MYIGEIDYSGTGEYVVFRNAEDGIVYGNEQHNVRVRDLTLSGIEFDEEIYTNSVYKMVWRVNIGNETHISTLKSVEMR